MASNLGWRPPSLLGSRPGSDGLNLVARPSQLRLEASIATRLEVMAIWLEAIAIRLEVIATRLEVIALWLEAIVY